MSIEHNRLNISFEELRIACSVLMSRRNTKPMATQAKMAENVSTIT